LHREASNLLNAAFDEATVEVVAGPAACFNISCRAAGEAAVTERQNLPQ
jgi:hypothetical protein